MLRRFMWWRPIREQISHLFPFASESRICQRAESAASRLPPGTSTSVSCPVSQPPPTLPHPQPTDENTHTSLTYGFYTRFYTLKSHFQQAVYLALTPSCQVFLTDSLRLEKVGWSRGEWDRKGNGEEGKRKGAEVLRRVEPLTQMGSGNGCHGNPALPPVSQWVSEERESGVNGWMKESELLTRGICLICLTFFTKTDKIIHKQANKHTSSTFSCFSWPG